MNKLLIICLVAVAINAATLDLDAVRNKILQRHNYYRAKHQASALVRESEIEAIAQSYTESIIKSGGILRHSQNEYKNQHLGENLYSGTNIKDIGTACVELWYSEEPSYNYKNPGFSSSSGHFSQLVWKNSKKLGCGIGCNSQNECYVTCNYYPAGNYLNQYTENVSPATGSTSGGEEPDTTTSGDNTGNTGTTGDSGNTGNTGNTSSELEAFIKDALNKHNYYRALHQAGNLVRDSTLERIALENAEYMIQTKSFQFTDAKYENKPIGQNLYMSSGSDPDGAKATDKWYSGVSNYDFSKPGYSSQAGGFTQVVWKNTKKIGCAYACESRTCYVTCLYYPSGNYNGQFETNVLPKK